MAKTVKQHKEEVEQFTSQVQQAAADGMIAINPDGTILFGDNSVYQSGFAEMDPNDPILQRLSAEASIGGEQSPTPQEECLCGDGRRGGILMGTSATMLDYSQQQFVSVPEAGTENLGYAVWGPMNALPTAIFKSAASFILTASVLDYLERTIFGLGPKVVYRISRYSGGSVTHEEIPYEDADVYLKNHVISLLEKIDQLQRSEEQTSAEGAQAPSDGTSNERSNVASPAHASATPVPIASPMGIQPKKPTPSPLIAHYQKELEAANNDLESYYKTKVRIDALLENNNLSLFYKRWIADSIRLGICFPMIGMARGKAGAWETEIVRLDMRDACVMRLEERNPDNGLSIDNVYYSERWREDCAGKLQSLDIVSYPAIMPDHAVSDLRDAVNKNTRTKVGERPYWFCCPTFQPTPTKPYYPQMPWWSIFPSQVYQYAVTIVYDKAASRKNSTMWGKILFINTAYLAQIFAQAGEKGKTPEGQAQIRAGIYKKVEEFLKRRDNNGKLLVMDSYPSADEKQMIDSVRIVDVPQNTDVKASTSEISEMASLISYGFGVNMDLVGSRPGTAANSTGTAQRELHLLKNGQLSTDRVSFTDFFNNFVFRFNNYDPHFRMAVPYPTLTTLDNSKTGIKEVADGNI